MAAFSRSRRWARPTGVPFGSSLLPGAARRVEQDFARGGVLLPQVRAVGADLAHLAAGEVAGAAEEFLGHGVGVGVLGPADVIEVDLHSGGISTTRAPRQRRSRS